VRFISKLETGYKSRDDVPFHNRSHAADVVQGTAYFLNQAAHQIGELQPLDVFSLILSAAMHDHNHPGVTNAFMVNSKDELAILYNDASVLEMHHLASSWRLLLDNAANPFEGFSPEQYNEARQTIIHVILGTDMKYHFDHLTKFKTRIGSDCEWSDRKDVRLILAMCLHSADVGNPAKPWKLSCEWSARVMDEFFRQGDTEASRGMAVSPFMDREKTDIAKCQVGFINILIKPFFEEWGTFLKDAGTQLTDNITLNIGKWTTEGENALGEERAALLKAKPVVAEVSEIPLAVAAAAALPGSTPSSPVGKRAALGLAAASAPGASPGASPSKTRNSARS